MRFFTENRLERSEALLSEFDFIKEKVKRKPIDKKKAVRNVVFVVLLAVIFGAVASMTFVFLQPKLKEWTEAKNREQLSLEFEDGEQNLTVGEQTGEDSYAGLSELAAIDESVQALAKEASGFLVNVLGVTSEMDWFEEITESSNQTTGIVISKSEEQLLVLTNRDALKRVSSITVTLPDGTMSRAEEITFDTTNNLSILKISTAGISNATLDTVKEARFGSSEQINQGNIVLAVGAPLGHSGGVVYGHLTTKKNIASLDHVLELYLTDIVASEEGNGVLINTAGRVVGIISQEQADDAAKNLITAVSVDSLERIIEKLMNGSKVGYVGIEGVTVTADIASLEFIGEGIYVTKVKKDSPAMHAGIQNGDIIFKVNSNELATIEDFHEEILSRNVDETIEVYAMRMGRGDYKELIFDVKLGGY